MRIYTSCVLEVGFVGTFFVGIVAEEYNVFFTLDGATSWKQPNVVADSSTTSSFVVRQLAQLSEDKVCQNIGGGQSEYFVNGCFNTTHIQNKLVYCKNGRVDASRPSKTDLLSCSSVGTSSEQYCHECAADMLTCSDESNKDFACNDVLSDPPTCGSDSVTFSYPCASSTSYYELKGQCNDGSYNLLTSFTSCPVEAPYCFQCNPYDICTDNANANCDILHLTDSPTNAPTTTPTSAIPTPVPTVSSSANPTTSASTTAGNNPTTTPSSAIATPGPTVSSAANPTTSASTTAASTLSTPTTSSPSTSSAISQGLTHTAAAAVLIVLTRTMISN